MRLGSTIVASGLLLGLLVTACGDDDENPPPTTGGTGGEAGVAGAAGTDGGAEAAAFWEESYDPAGLPDVQNGKHSPGMNCERCHASGDETFLFGGTVYEADGTTAAPNVEVGVRDGTNFYSSYTATNGNFWVLATGGATIDWANADVRVRNQKGERQKEITATSGACNSCHTGAAALKEP
jgi:hypothetical protein